MTSDTVFRRFESDLRRGLKNKKEQRDRLQKDALQAMDHIADHLEHLEATIKNVIPRGRLSRLSDPELVDDTRARCTYELSGEDDPVPVHFDFLSGGRIMFIVGEQRHNESFDLLEGMAAFYSALHSAVIESLVDGSDRRRPMLVVRT
jgi:hypothetical protein